MFRYSVERSPIGRGRYLYRVEAEAEGCRIPVFTSRFPEAAHERKEALEAASAKVEADRRARNCDLPLEPLPSGRAKASLFPACCD